MNCRQSTITAHPWGFPWRLTTAKFLLPSCALILIPLVSEGQANGLFEKLRRDKTYKFEMMETGKLSFDLYYCIGSKPVVFDSIQYLAFNFSFTRKGENQVIRFENDRVLIATHRTLRTKGVRLGESVLFDFSAPVGTTWPLDIENSGFISTSIVKFVTSYWSECLRDSIFIFDINESIRASHTPYFTRFYVTMGYGIIGFEMERQVYPTDRLETIRQLNPLLKKLDCAEIAQENSDGMRLIPGYR